MRKRNYSSLLECKLWFSAVVKDVSEVGDDKVTVIAAVCLREVEQLHYG